MYSAAWCDRLEALLSAERLRSNLISCVVLFVRRITSGVPACQRALTMLSIALVDSLEYYYSCILYSVFCTVLYYFQLTQEIKYKKKQFVYYSIININNTGITWGQATKENTNIFNVDWYRTTVQYTLQIRAANKTNACSLTAPESPRDHARVGQHVAIVRCYSTWAGGQPRTKQIAYIDHAWRCARQGEQTEGGGGRATIITASDRQISAARWTNPRSR